MDTSLTILVDHLRTVVREEIAEAIQQHLGGDAAPVAATAPRGSCGAVTAAEYIGVTPGHLAKMRVQGTGPRYRKAGARVIYDYDDLDAWKAQHRRRSTSEAA